MKKLFNLTAVVCGTVFLLGVGLAQAEPERGEPQYGGTVNILTRLAALNPLSFNQYDFVWKTNPDGLFLDHLARGDLNFGPRGTGENSFKSLSFRICFEVYTFNKLSISSCLDIKFCEKSSSFKYFLNNDEFNSRYKFSISFA